MKIELDNLGLSSKRISAYSSGEFTIAEKVYRTSVLVSPADVNVDWPPVKLSDLKMEHIQQIAALKPEIVILGTGKTLTFPPEAVLKPLRDANIGFEIMDTGAACRSYNFLVGEGRQVIAALLIMEN